MPPTWAFATLPLELSLRDLRMNKFHCDHNDAESLSDCEAADDCRSNDMPDMARGIDEFPDALPGNWGEADSFAQAFDLQLRRHGEVCHQLHKALNASDSGFSYRTFQRWRTGESLPGSIRSFAMLSRIERRYRLEDGYFRKRLGELHRAPQGLALSGLSRSERCQIAWHLPSDFDYRLPDDQAEILEWVRTVIVSGATHYRRYHKKAMQDRFGLRFWLPELIDGEQGQRAERYVGNDALDAPLELRAEMADLVRFKTATLTSIGDRRFSSWAPATMQHRLTGLSLMFGALVAPRRSAIVGLAVPPAALTTALLTFPRIWDWYLRWREARRGFYTRAEYNMLLLGASLTRQETGWLRQRCALAHRLQPIAGILTQAEIDVAMNDWDAHCDRAHDHCRQWANDVTQVQRVHGDRLEPVLPVLESDNPAREYRRIADEIVSRMPDAARYPKAAAETMRGLLMIRFALHLGVRQKNLRELLFCQRGNEPRTCDELERLKRGELRWNDRADGWEVFIPCNAFKNSYSTFFRHNPFQIILPDIGNLYTFIGEYLDDHRPKLIATISDPGTFFVKSVKGKCANAVYDNATFYTAWRLMIQRYGVYNPYTKRGAIEGLLPHGPNCVRAVLATHVLKTTGSFEQASYAIQNTAQTVAKFYGRFLPGDKAAIATRVLNEVWEDD